jgi:predicted PurR-regulated permease PerM
MGMAMRDSVVGTAVAGLGDWLQAMVLDALIVGALWLVGLLALRVPYALIWAGLAVVLQLVPIVGGMLTLVGPAIAAVAMPGDSLFHLSMVFGLYAVIVILDGLVVGPYVLHRRTLVPWWAALLGPVVLGLLIPPWGVVIAPPLLVVGFAVFGRRERRA